ncbi:MAG: hypothetical protein WA139_00345 [Candidatus Aenigmatarchaeota archaeon]
MNIPDDPFGEFLKEIGVPKKHSLFAAAYSKNAWGEHYDFTSNDYEIIGFRLMPLKEAVSYGKQGKGVLWFYDELKRRYENIFYFFNPR